MNAAELFVLGYIAGNLPPGSMSFTPPAPDGEPAHLLMRLGDDLVVRIDAEVLPVQVAAAD